MEQIPQDVIEMAEDFLNHLSMKETGDLLKDFFFEQLFFSEIIISVHKNMKDQELAKKHNLLFMLIYKCYKYYDIPIPVISREIILSTHDQFIKSLSVKPNQKQTLLEMMMDMKTLIKQDNLMDYLILKVCGTIKNPVTYQTENDMNLAISETIVIILVLNNEMKKHIGDEIN